VPRRFQGTLSFAGHTVSTDGSFTSKKLAKEDVCKRAIPIVEHIIPGSNKRKSIETSGDHRIGMDELNSANWIGTLQSMRSSYRCSAPTCANTL